MASVLQARRDDIEFCRILSTFLIVWYHCSPGTQFIPYAGLVFFIVTSAYLCMESKRNTLALSLAKARGFMILWVIWYAIYLAFEFLATRGEEYLSESVVVWVLVGPSVHLWYLPFLAALLIVLQQLRIYVAKKILMIIGLALFVISQLCVDDWRNSSIQWGVPAAQYLHALPAVFLGVAFAGASEISRRGKILLCILAIVATGFAWHLPAVGITYLLGILLSLPLLFRLKTPVALAPYSIFARYMLGIYLVHPIVIRVVRRITGLDGLLLAVLVFAGAFFVVWATATRGGRFSRIFQA